MKSNETVNGHYFFRWDSPEGQAALKAANAVLASSGLQIHYATGMAPGLLGDKVPDEASAAHASALEEAQRVEREEEARQQAVRDMVRAAEAKAADNG